MLCYLVYVDFFQFPFASFPCSFFLVCCFCFVTLLQPYFFDALVDNGTTYFFQRLSIFLIFRGFWFSFDMFCVSAYIVLFGLSSKNNKLNKVIKIIMSNNKSDKINKLNKVIEIIMSNIKSNKNNK